MKKDNYIKKVSNIIRYKISIIFKKYINDIRIRDISIIEVKISNNFDIMKIFVIFSTIAKDEVIIKMNVLNRTKNFITKNIYKNINIRKIPKIIFVYDKSIENGFNINNLLKKNIICIE